MKKITKIFLAITAAIGLLGTNAVVANATPTANLTYDQLIETATYKELQAASAASSAYLATQSGVEVQTTIEMALGANNVSVESKIEATKTAVRVSVSAAGTNLSYLWVNGKAYLPMNSYLESLDGDYPDDLVSRIPNGENRIIQMAKVPDELADSLPSMIFSPTQDSALSGTIQRYKELLDMFQFSEVTKVVSADDPTFMDYNFDMVMSSLGSTAVIHETATFKNGFMTGVRITTGSEQTQVLETNIIYTINNNLVIDAPVANTLISEASVKKVITQAAIEGKLQSKATAIIKKATALAKKAKAQLAAKHLTSAADSLKTKYTKITNGIKISVTVSKSKGNLCITTVKGKTATKTC